MVLVGSATLPGSRYGSLNQDYVLTDVLHSPEDLARMKVPQAYVALVLDGHGMLGEVAAADAAAAIMAALKASLLRSRALGAMEPSHIEQILVDAFHEGHDAAMQAYEAPPRTYAYPRSHPEERRYTLTRHSGHAVYSHPTMGPRLLEFGTTATAVVVQGRCLAVAHAGDSLVVVGREEEGSDAGYEGETVTERHSGAHEGERERLEQRSGKKARIRGNDGYITVPCPGPGAAPGAGTFSLAMTRALGHRFMSDYGVIPTPEVTVMRLGPRDVCIIAASDGVWEGLDARSAVCHVCDAMANHNSPDEAAGKLCRAALDAVMAADRRARPDNTTAALIIFDEVLGEESEEEVEGEGRESGSSQGTPETAGQNDNANGSGRGALKSTSGRKRETRAARE